MNDLYSVIVVDDEPKILKGMVETYNWKKVGFSVCKTAQSGELALELLKNTIPAVLMVDIRMKEMDGFELIRRARAIDTNIEFIVVSAYKDFDYAKSACQLGAFSYLLKPFSDKEFLSVMHSLREHLDNKKNQLRNLELYDQYKNDIVTRRVRAFLLGGVDIGSFHDQINRIDGDLSDYSWYCCLCVDVNSLPEIRFETTIENRNIQFQLFVDTAAKYFNFLHFELLDNRLLLVIQSPYMNIEIYGIIRQLWGELANKDSLFLAACGEMQQGFSGMLNSFEQCMAGIELVYERESDPFIVYKTQTYKPAAQYLYPKSREIDVLTIIKTGDFDILEQRILEFQKAVEQMNADKFFSKNCYQMFCLNIQFLLCQLYQINENGLEAYNRFMNEVNAIHKNQFARALQLAIKTVIQNSEERSIEKAGDFAGYIEKAIVFTEQNLDKNDLSIVDVADNLHLNAVYFGRIFKNGTNQSYREFLHQRRMQRAAILLDTTSQTIAEVAHQVGIENPSYFSLQFKRYTGTLPSEYKGK